MSACSNDKPTGSKKASRICLNKHIPHQAAATPTDVGKTELPFELPLRVATLINKSSNSFSEFSRVVTQQAGSIFMCSRSSLFLVLPHDETKLHGTMRSCDVSELPPLEVELPSDCGLPASAISSNVRIATSEILAVPIRREPTAGSIGVFILIRTSSQPAFSPSDVALADTFDFYLFCATSCSRHDILRHPLF
eukprot:TRINITY_DN4666_c0_g1_i2.p1 TRINITY_DN4666_c0_g1~~TRINITY_DN4666_c0_g1_i2.p1  ORF type:complete len:194 (+),score=28.41 TRINITY_DN4666_c0_g1_i2:278-859(+)